jgi:hypothetical protein
MMVGFEMFDIGAWSEDGLTMQIKTPTRAAVVTRRSGAWRVTLALAFAAVAAPSFATTSNPVQQLTTAFSDVRVSSTVASPDDVPDGYWPKLMSAMDQWEPIETPEIDCTIDAFI